MKIRKMDSIEVSFFFPMTDDSVNGDTDVGLSPGEEHSTMYENNAHHNSMPTKQQVLAEFEEYLVSGPMEFV